MFTVYLHTQFNIIGPIDTIVIAVKLKAK